MRVVALVALLTVGGCDKLFGLGTVELPVDAPPPPDALAPGTWDRVAASDAVLQVGSAAWTAVSASDDHTCGIQAASSATAPVPLHRSRCRWPGPGSPSIPEAPTPARSATTTRSHAGAMARPERSAQETTSAARCQRRSRAR